MPVLRIAVTVMVSGEKGPRDNARTAEIAPQAVSSWRPTRPSSTRHDRGKGNRNSARSQSEWWAAAIIALRARSKLAGLGPMTANLDRPGHARSPRQRLRTRVPGRSGQRLQLPTARRVPPRALRRTGRPSPFGTVQNHNGWKRAIAGRPIGHALSRKQATHY